MQRKKQIYIKKLTKCQYPWKALTNFLVSYTHTGTHTRAHTRKHWEIRLFVCLLSLKIFSRHSIAGLRIRIVNPPSWKRHLQGTYASVYVCVCMCGLGVSLQPALWHRFFFLLPVNLQLPWRCLCLCLSAGVGFQYFTPRHTDTQTQALGEVAVSASFGIQRSIKVRISGIYKFCQQFSLSHPFAVYLCRSKGAAGERVAGADFCTLPPHNQQLLSQALIIYTPKLNAKKSARPKRI